MSISKDNSKIELASKLFPEFPILGFLFKKPAYGYELFQSLQELKNTWRFSLGQVYNILNRLETADYVKSIILDKEKLPAKRYFSITVKGKKHFLDWIRKTTPISVRAIRIEFLTRLYFTRKLFPGLIDQIFNDQIELVNDSLSDLREEMTLTPAEEVFNLMNIDFRIKQIESTLYWLNECRKVFEEH